MKIIIFDLDFTLVNTAECQPYLISPFGRESVVEKIISGSVHTSTYDGIADYFDELSDDDEVLVIVISDSPKAYCLAILEHHGLGIDEDLVFGSAGKPCVDFSSITSSLLDNGFIKDEDDNEYIVIGDSAKDIYFAHEIGCPSVFVKWGHQYDNKLISDWSEPTLEVDSVSELRPILNKFISSGIIYNGNHIKNSYSTVEGLEISPYQISEGNIGYSREYIPMLDECTEDRHRYAWFDMNLTIKKAKTLSVMELNKNNGVNYYSRAGDIRTSKGLMTIAGHYKKEFYEWMKQKGIKGDVTLIPVPSSLPFECNRSNPTRVICDWWAAWTNKEQRDYKLIVHPIVERWKPTKASHKGNGVRTMTPHLESIGVYSGIKLDKVIKTPTVIIFDDVVTSGSQMNAVATILNTLGLIDASMNIYGYALAKTTHPNPLSKFDFSQLLAELDEATSKN